MVLVPPLAALPKKPSAMLTDSRKDQSRPKLADRCMRGREVDFSLENEPNLRLI